MTTPITAMEEEKTGDMVRNDGKSVPLIAHKEKTGDIVKNDGKADPLIAHKVENLSDDMNSGFKLKVYKRRWLILGLFILYSGGTTYQWVQYSIISNIVSRYYGVSSLAVDWTSMSYMAYYVILIFPASYFEDRLGLRWSTILGNGLSCLGSWMKILSVAPDRFYVTCIGQSLVASTQTLVLTAPGRLAACWFDADHLSTATSLAILGNQLGVALGFLITPIAVRNHEQLDNISADLSRMFWSMAVFTTVTFLLIVIFFQDEPKLPPNETRALQKISRPESTKGEFMETMKRLFTNRHFLVFCNSYGLNVGVFNAIGTLLNQMYLVHFTNGEEDAGRIGLIIVVSGILGSVLMGIILDKTHKFKETTVTVYFLTFCGQVLFALALYFEIKWMVYASAIFLGFFMSGYFALGYEMCAEYTYPESENMATGILNVANNIYGIILVIIMGKLLYNYGDVSVHTGLCIALFIGFILTLLTKDEQRRQDAKKAVRYQAIRLEQKDISSTKVV